MPSLYLIGAVFLVILVAFCTVRVYNTLVRLKNLLQEAWSGIDVQLKRRHNLIPNLVDMVQGYAKHERGVFEEVARTRDGSMKARDVKEAEVNENALSQTLKSLFALVEAYPDLKANANYLELQKQLSEVEDEIQLARRYYNGTVRDFNIGVQSFPSIIVAHVCGFKRADFFELETATEREAPKVEG